MITESSIKKTMQEAAQLNTIYQLSDGGGRGEGRLILVARPSGAAEWYASWHRDGRRRQVKIGGYPALSLVQARKVFRNDYAPSISTGAVIVGPRTQRERAGVTVKDLFVAYVDSLEKRGAASWQSIERSLLGGPDRDGGAGKCIGFTKRAADVTPDDITPCLGAIYARGSRAMAAITRLYISAAFSYGMKATHDYRGAGAASKWGIAVNPVSAIAADPDATKPGERHLSPAEIKAFWLWLDAQATPLASAAQVIICTGQRISEILRLDVAAYDAGEKLFDWSKTKNKKPHTIPIIPRATAIMDGLTPNRHGLYFPNARDNETPATDGAVKSLVDRYLLESKAVKFTPRDLRRTWKTQTGAAGLSKEIRDRLQNHALQDVGSRHYDRYSYMPEKRAAVEVWAKHLDGILT